MKQKALDRVFVWGFLFLYLLVATISFCHAVQFFNIGNVQWMSIVLAFSFELGLALSLAAILLSEKNKSNVLPWILMTVLTLVQVVGNVYSTFKYISLSEVEYYQYLAKPLLFFIEDVEENTIQVIVSWIIGAILPIIALMMTDMVATNIKNTSEESSQESSQPVQIREDKEESRQEKKEDDDNILSYMNDDGKPIWEKSPEDKKAEIPKPIQKPVPQQKPTVKSSNHVTNKTEPVGNIDNVDNTNKHVANTPYFRGPEIKRK